MKDISISKMLSTPLCSKYQNDTDYNNRDLNWLEFNKRVLHQVVRKDLPIGEKVNFLAISMSNLDEFIMVRFSNMIRCLRDRVPTQDMTNLSVADEYTSLRKSIGVFKKLQNRCYNALKDEMKTSGIKLCKFNNLSKSERRAMKDIFISKIYPLLAPINFNANTEFPHLVSKQVTIVVLLEDPKSENGTSLSFIPLSSGIDKIFKVSPKKEDRRYILLEDIIYAFLDEIYQGRNIVEHGAIRLLREYDTSLEANSDEYITERMKRSLFQNKYSYPVYMDVSKGLSDTLVKIIRKIFHLNKKHIFRHAKVMDFSALREIDFEKSEKYKKFTPLYPSELKNDDIFNIIDEGDVLLHHPYESYDPIIRFLEEASTDPEVISIRQTLYRVSSKDSPIVNALCNAAESGKQVSVVLEIKARFDEETNISLIEKLKDSGCQLVYSDELLKIHCKFIIITKKHNRKVKTYCHIGTGNYNEKTSKLYTDISYLTANPDIAYGLISLYNAISGFSNSHTDNHNKLYYSPYGLKKKIIKMIDKEIRNAKRKDKCGITFKMNSITDPEVIAKLYEASEVGVPIVIYCRGICTMKPINDNIKIVSIVGRFLEHSRIYQFHNGGKATVFMSSADMMIRNLDNRYELMFKVTDYEMKRKLLVTLGMYFGDEYNSYIMNKDGLYDKIDGDSNVHSLFMETTFEDYNLTNVPKRFYKGIGK